MRIANKQERDYFFSNYDAELNNHGYASVKEHTEEVLKEVDNTLKFHDLQVVIYSSDANEVIWKIESLNR